MKNLFFLVLVAFFSVQCSNAKNSKEEFPEHIAVQLREIRTQNMNYYNEFLFSGDSAYIDSALYVIDKGLVISENRDGILVMYKLYFLKASKRFDDAIAFWKTVDPSPFRDFGEFYCDLTTYKLYISKYEFQNDTDSISFYTAKAFQLIDDYVQENKEDIIDYINSKDDDFETIQGKYLLALAKYQYYYGRIYGDYKQSELIQEIQKRCRHSKSLFQDIDIMIKQGGLEDI